MQKALIFLVFINIKLENEIKTHPSLSLNMVVYLDIFAYKGEKVKKPPLNMALYSHSF